MGVRVLHLADVHLGIESYGRLDPQTGLNSRLADFTACLDQAVDRALHDDIDLFLFAGDAYRNRDPNPTLQREFALRVRRLSEAGIVVFLLVGNHDLPNAFGRATALEIFHTLGVPNVHVARRPDLLHLETRRGPVQVVAMPWIARSQLLAADEYKGKSLDELNRVIADRISRFVAARAREVNPTEPAILVGHLSVLGAKAGSEYRQMLGGEVAIPRSALALPAFDYVALGHVHCRQVLGEQPPTIYAGSIERVDFSEERETKGYAVAEVSSDRCTYELVDVNARRFVTIEVVAKGDNPLEQVLREVQRQQTKDAVVRLQVQATPQTAARLSIGEVRRALKDAYHVVVSVHAEPERRQVFRGQFPEAMTPRQSLEAYLRHRKVRAEHARTLVDYGDRLLAGLSTAEGEPQPGLEATFPSQEQP